MNIIYGFAFIALGACVGIFANAEDINTSDLASMVTVSAGLVMIVCGDKGKRNENH